MRILVDFWAQKSLGAVEVKSVCIIYQPRVNEARLTQNLPVDYFEDGRSNGYRSYMSFSITTRNGP